jgi:cation:H+ antiporter
MVAVAALALVVVVPDGVTVAEGVVLLVLMAVVLGLLLRAAITHRDDPVAPETDEFLAAGARRRVAVEVGRTVAGLVGTAIGSQLLLQGALSLADIFGLRSGVVGVTLLAVGTSLPELVTVVQAARRNEHDLVVGNLLGSNLFNSFAVAGLVGVLGGAVVDPDVTVGVIAGLGLTVVVGVVLYTGRRVTRGEGLLLFATYGLLLAFVI